MYPITTFDGKKMKSNILGQPELSLYEYLALARQLLARTLKQRNAKFLITAYNNEDIVANLANKIMIADMKYDPTKCSLATWRFGATKLFLRGLWKGIARSKEFQEKSISPDIVSEVLDDRKYQKYNNNREMVEYYMSFLTEKEKEYINLYYFENHTYQMIGDKYGITCEGARQRIQKIINKMKEININE